jgi:defect-in-organelle-trafficking protein DotD
MKLCLRLSPFVFVLAFAGCATKPAVTGISPDSEAFARQVIVDKVDAAVQAQRELAAATVEGKEMTLRKQSTLDQDEVDIDYVGMPQPLLESIAYRYGYKYIETGKRIELNVVNLRVQHKKVLEVIRDISYQIDGVADVVLDKDAKIVRLVYKKG